MKLDRITFEGGWTKLANRFSRVPKAAQDDYFAFLTHKVSPHEFKQAVDVLFGSASSFPRPNEFLAAVPGEGFSAGGKVPEDLGPYHQRVSYVLRSSPSGRLWQRIFADRSEAARNAGDAEADGARPVPPVEEHTGPPFYFPRPVVRLVDSVDEVRVEWDHRTDLERRGDHGRPHLDLEAS